MKTKLWILFLIIPFCSINAQQNPIGNFEKLWKTFDERYANFELKKVGWNDSYKKYRPQINAQTTNQELFNICCAMLQELNDGHVGIDAEIGGKECECGPPYTYLLEDEFITEADAIAFKKVMENTFNKYGFSNPTFHEFTEDTHFQYRTSKKYGYFRLDEMVEAITFRRFDRRMDEMMEQFEDKEAVIIDLRFNGGGWDRISYKIANRFVNKKQIGHHKKTRIKGTHTFSKLKTWYLKPKGKRQFNKNIIILTSDYTASAAEVLVLALGQLPNVQIVGDTTEGIFSDMYEFKLLNKWEVSLSHMQFFSSDMINYEGIGIEPDHYVVNSKKDIESGVDAVLEYVLNLPLWNTQD